MESSVVIGFPFDMGFAYFFYLPVLLGAESDKELVPSLLSFLYLLHLAI